MFSYFQTGKFYISKYLAVIKGISTYNFSAILVTSRHCQKNMRRNGLKHFPSRTNVAGVSFICKTWI